MVVRNGQIAGNWHTGVSLDNAAGVVCENLVISATSVRGIHVGDRARVLKCQVDGGTTGISLSGLRVGEASIVADCIVSNCMGDGFNIGDSGTVRNCIAIENDPDGFSGGAYVRT